MNPDIQGRIVTKLSLESLSSCVLLNLRQRERETQRNLRLTLQLVSSAERYVLIDKLFEQFERKTKSEDAALGKFAEALIMLKNLGFFVKSSHKSVWKKMFYSKSSFRTNDVRALSYKT